jgi:hypothetical protein
LVGAKRDSQTASAAPASKPAATETPTKPVVTPVAKSPKNGHTRNAPAAVISLAAAGSRQKSELPMDGDFTSF